MTNPAPLRCSSSVMATDYANSKIVLMDTGNYPSYSSFLNETWLYTTAAGWVNTSSTLMNANGPVPGRINGVMAYDGANVILYGGQSGSSTAGVLEDCYSWSNSTHNWTQISGTMPFGRYKAEAAYLYGTGMIIFGGETIGNILEETWIWTQATQSFAQASPGNVPAARTGHVMAGKSASAYALMFGGKGTNSLFNDTWYYDTNWHQLSPGTSPSVRSEACMSYDTNAGKFVMFGGTNGATYLQETWVFDPSAGSWTEVFGTQPAARVGAMMAYEATTHATIMYGGISAADNYPSNHSWSFSMSTMSWTRL